MALLHHGRTLDLAARDSDLAQSCAMVEVGIGYGNCKRRRDAVTSWLGALIWSRRLARNAGNNPLVGGTVMADDLRSARVAENLQTPLMPSGLQVNRA